MTYLFRRCIPIFLAVFWSLGLPALSHAATTSTPSVETNDTFSSKQWYLDAIHAREGWVSSTGSRDVVVAVIDSAVDITHADLKQNIWTNPNEIAGNNKDDDGDGYIDDVHGWNFVLDIADVTPTSSGQILTDAWIHGTVVASLIAGEGNNGIGIAGVSWRARIMPLVVLDGAGTGGDGHIVRAIRYAVAHGADIINLSLVGYEFDQDLADAIRLAASQGVLVVSAAGNSDDAGGQDMDQLPGYPACHKGVLGLGELTVTGIDRLNQKVNKANFGACVDVTAPGQDIFAARPTVDPHEPNTSISGYVGHLSGTSVAAPLVSGLAALLKAKHPEWRGQELAEQIRRTSDPFDAGAFAGKLGVGRVNVARALKEDNQSALLGPLSLEGSAPGSSPEVRILTAGRAERMRLQVGSPTDRRGVRAAFIRWNGTLEPQIAVTMIGDPKGAWSVFRLDGVLLAAGEIGKTVEKGLFLAAADLDASGKEVLFLGEANGHRAWLVSEAAQDAREISTLEATDARGISAVSITRPVPSFLINAKFGAQQIAVIGARGVRLAHGVYALKKATDGRTMKRTESQGGAGAYALLTRAAQLVLTGDAVGVHPSRGTISLKPWKQIPEGERRQKGWNFYETWPR